MTASRRGFTLVEASVALGLLTVLLLAVWMVFGHLFPREGPLSLFTATSRGLVLQQSRTAIRKLFYRIREGIQIIEPVPGKTQTFMVFRDVRNRVVRLEHDAAHQRLVTQLFTATGQRDRPDPSEDLQSIQIDACETALFTALTPATVCVSFTTRDDRVKETYMTVITLANTRLDR